MEYYLKKNSALNSATWTLSDPWASFLHALDLLVNTYIYHLVSPRYLRATYRTGENKV